MRDINLKHSTLTCISSRGAAYSNTAAMSTYRNSGPTRSVRLFVMSLSATAYPFPWGHGVNPSLVSGRGQGTPWTGRQLIAGPSLMSNVGFSILLKDTSTCCSALPRAGIWTSDLLITSRPALPTELQPHKHSLLGENGGHTYIPFKISLGTGSYTIWPIVHLFYFITSTKLYDIIVW